MPTQPAWEKLEAFWLRFKGLLPEPPPEDPKCKVLDQALRFRDLLHVADRRRGATLAELLSFWESEPKVTMKWWSNDHSKQKQIRAQVEKLVGEFQTSTVRPWLAAWRQYVYRLVMTMLVGGREFARDARRSALKLNYGDLLQKAATLLRGNLEVRRALQQKYRWLFVDEFQDTDPIQVEVLLLLASVEDSSLNARWADVRLRKGALFIVGDPKQSIFRFRRADIEMYNRVRQLIKSGGGQVVPLTASFRAVPELCTWANKVFRGMLPKQATAQEPAFSPLEAVRKPEVPLPGHASAPVGIRTLTAPAGLARNDVAAADAEAIARYICREVNTGRRQWQDFLILTRKRKHLEIYAKALDELRIPVEVSGAGAFGGSSSVKLLASLLSALCDPDDGVALVGVLRGPIFGISDQDLFRYRRAGHPFILTAPLPEDGVLSPGIGPVVTALRSLQRMYHWTRTLPAPAAVERILEATGLLAMLAATSAGGAEAGDLLHAVDRVRWAVEEGGSLADAVTALYEDMESSEVESVPLEPGRRGVVRLMNLHKAKGLEAPVVFLADPCGGVQRRADIRIIRDGDRALGFFPIRRTKGEYARELLAEPADWDKHEAEELTFVQAEELRLLYVAGTRARDLLVISRWGKGGNGPWAPFDPDLNGVAELFVPKNVRAPESQKVDLTPEKRAIDAARRDEQRGCATPTWSVQSVTGASSRAVLANKAARTDREMPSPTVSEEPGKDDGKVQAEGDGPGTSLAAILDHRTQAAGTAWGTLIHALLEHALRHPGLTITDIERMANWLTLSHPEMRPLVPEAVETVSRVKKSEAWQRAAAAEKCYVEVPFAVCESEPSGHKRLVHGVIDLVYETPDGWEILDYKTDQVSLSPVQILERHSDQLEAYGQYWSRQASGAVCRAGLYLVRTGDVVWMK